MPVVELFRALGDPTRLEMVQRLSRREPHTIKSVSSGLSITRQGARKHLQILADAELVTLCPEGRETGVVLERDKLEQGKIFIAGLERQWDARMGALRRYVDKDLEK